MIRFSHVSKVLPASREVRELYQTRQPTWLAKRRRIPAHIRLTSCIPTPFPVRPPAAAAAVYAPTTLCATTCD